MTDQTLCFTPIQPWIGAEVGGIDLSKPLSKEMVARLREAWLKYRVLVFRDQNITREQHKTFAGYFGDLDVHPVFSLPDHPEIVPIKMLAEMNMRGKLQEWHTDVTYTAAPPAAAFLRGITIPAIGGDTAFVNSVKAYALLDEPTRSRIRHMTAIHEPDFALFISDKDKLQAMLAKNPPMEHPMVTVHPETGEEALFVNDHFTKHVAGVPEAEGRQLLDRLFYHLTHPEFQMRVSWRPDTLVMWDERSTQHYAVTDYDEPRYLERITIRGERPKGLKYARVS